MPRTDAQAPVGGCLANVLLALAPTFGTICRLFAPRWRRGPSHPRCGRFAGDAWPPMSKSPDHRRETVRRRRHRARARRLHAPRRLLRERPLRALVGGRPPARDRHAGGRGGQARQVDVRAPAGDPVEVRAEADREEREPAEDAAEAHQAQGRRRADQCLRRRTRRRAHLPLHRAVRESGQADPAPVAAVDDDRGDPRRLRASCAPTRRCARSPTPPSAAPNRTGSSASTARAR